MTTEAFSLQDKYRTILCVKYVRHELSIKRLKMEMEYQAHVHYDANVEQEIDTLRESIVYYDELIEKLNDLMY